MKSRMMRMISCRGKWIQLLRLNCVLGQKWHQKCKKKKKNKKLATFPAGTTSWAQNIQGSVCPWFVVCTVLSVICTRENQVTSVGADMANPAHSVDSPRGLVAMTSQSNKATSGATSFQSINFSHTLCTISHDSCLKKKKRKKKQRNKWM